MYELTNVELRYGQRVALSIPSLRIDAGERVAFLGPNGSGKTSLLKLLDGLIAPSSGSVLRSGRPPSATDPPPRSVYLHQYPYLLTGTVAYNVGFGCRARGMTTAEARKRIDSVMELLALGGMEKRSSRELSGGEAQRVALARALASGAEILLLDEPSASADATSAALIIQALRLCAEGGTTVVFSSHDETFAGALRPRTVRLAAGSIARDTTNGGTP